MNSKELGRECERLRAELKAMFDAAITGEIDQETGAHRYAFDETQVKEVRARESELAARERQRVSAEMSEIRQANEDALKGLATPSFPGKFSGSPARPGEMFIGLSQAGEVQNIARMVAESLQYKQRNPAQRNMFSVELRDIDVKTLLTTATGFAPVNARTNFISLAAERTPRLPDLIPSDPTTLQIIKYMRETTATHGAASVSEGAAKPESTFAYTEQSAPVVKIANWLPVTEEQIDDVPGLDNLINNRLMAGVRLKLEDKIINGPGGGSDMDGFYHTSGVQTQSKGADELQDAIYKAMQKVRWTGFAEPNAVAIHPDDWTPIRLLRTTGGTAGLYIWGPPSQAGPDTLWGKPVVQTPVMTAGRPLTGDFTTHAHLAIRQDMRVDVSDSHSDYFVRNLLAIRAEMRAALEIYRPSAFCYNVA